MMSASIIAVVLTALMGALVGRSYLNAHARNLTAAMNDATRVMEAIRRQNSGAANCPSGIPTAKPAGFKSWNDWLDAPAQGKSVRQPNQNQFELIAVTCQDDTGGMDPTNYCGAQAVGANPAQPAQVGTGEWRDANGRGSRLGVNTTFNPIRVTVAVGWHQRGRSAGGEFLYTPPTTTTSKKGSTTTKPATFAVGPDADGDGAIESPAMLTTLVTCR